MPQFLLLDPTQNTERNRATVLLQTAIDGLGRQTLELVKLGVARNEDTTRPLGGQRARAAFSTFLQIVKDERFAYTFFGLCTEQVRLIAGWYGLDPATVWSPNSARERELVPA